MVIYLAAYLTRKEGRIQDFQSGLLPALLVVGLLSGLVLMEPDLGTVVVLGVVTGSLLFVGAHACLICQYWCSVRYQLD